MHSLPSQFKSIRFSAHLDACLCYIDRDSRECHLLYSLLCTFWPCIRSPGNVLWEFKSLCLATAISLQSCAHMHSLRRQLWSSNELRELNQKQFGWDNIERVIKDESHNIYGAPQALYHRWKSVFDTEKKYMKYYLADLLTGYEGEFVTEDSLLTALQVPTIHMWPMSLVKWFKCERCGTKNWIFSMTKHCQLGFSGCGKAWRHGHWPPLRGKYKDA